MLRWFQKEKLVLKWYDASVIDNIVPSISNAHFFESLKTLGLVPLEDEDTDDELSDRSDSESSETSCEDLKLPDGKYLKKKIENNSKLIEEIENK